MVKKYVCVPIGSPSASPDPLLTHPLPPQVVMSNLPAAVRMMAGQQGPPAKRRSQGGRSGAVDRLSWSRFLRLLVVKAVKVHG